MFSQSLEISNSTLKNLHKLHPDQPRNDALAKNEILFQSQSNVYTQVVMYPYFSQVTARHNFVLQK